MYLLFTRTIRVSSFHSHNPSIFFFTRTIRVSSFHSHNPCIFLSHTHSNWGLSLLVIQNEKILYTFLIDFYLYCKSTHDIICVVTVLINSGRVTRAGLSAANQISSAVCRQPGPVQSGSVWRALACLLSDHLTNSVGTIRYKSQHHFHRREIE